MDREVLRTSPDGGVSRKEYDLDGRLAREVLPLEHAGRGAFAQGYRYTYDRAGRRLQATAPGGILYEQNTYDVAGNVIRDIDGAAYGFDLSGRRTSVTTPEGSSQTFAYDASGNLTRTTDSMGYTTRFQTDAWGRVTLVTRADGSHERYTYDHAGNILTATDGEGHTASYAYNCRGLLSSRTDAMGASEHFRYDREGNMVESTDRNGVRLTLTYNMYQSLTGRRSVDGGINEHFGYYPDGKLKYAIGGGMRYDYTYDAMGRLAGKSAGGRSLAAYTYDVGGNRTGLTDLTGKRTEYEYDYADRLRKVYDNGNCQACYTYNPDGTMKALEIGGNSGEGVLYTEYSYDRDRNLTGLKTLVRQGALNGKYGLLTDNHYSYDKAGNCVIKQTLSGETRYSYDSLYQLTEAVYPNKREQFTYDRAGNRLTRTAAREHGGAVREAYTYDNANRLTKRSIYNMTAGAQEIPETPEMADRMYRYTYDRQGNMLSDGDNTYQYDGMNRLKEINTKAGDIQKNHYDGEGLRAELEENGKLVSFIYDDGKIVTEGTDTNLIRYIRGYDLISSDSTAAKTYYHYASDELGSITHITDEEGNILNRYEYDAFGNFTVKEETIPNRFAFTGEQYDPVTSQYYLRARFYNPVIGRFLNEDTYYGDGLNLYTYCQNNPVEYVDPSGHVYIDKLFDNTNHGNSSSQRLGENIFEHLGINKSTTNTGSHQKQHLIPKEVYNNSRFLQQLGYNVDHHQNGIFDRNFNNNTRSLNKVFLNNNISKKLIDKYVSEKTHHSGYHSLYNNAVERKVDEIEDGIAKLRKKKESEGYSGLELDRICDREARKRVNALRENLRTMNQDGIDLYYEDKYKDQKQYDKKFDKQMREAARKNEQKRKKWHNKYG